MPRAHEHYSDATARREAKKLGWRAVKSRWHKNSLDNHGGFQLIDSRGVIILGERFDLNADDVVQITEQEPKRPKQTCNRDSKRRRVHEKQNHEHSAVSGMETRE